MYTNFHGIPGGQTRRTWMRFPATFIFSLALALPSAMAAVATYDAADRLTSITHADGTRATYSYDISGNLLSVRVDASAPPAVRVTEGISALVGQPITDYQVEVDRPDAVSGYVITGLPPGLNANRGRKINRQGKAPGVIFGTPAREGFYQVKIAARGSSGTGQTAVLAIHVINPFASGLDVVSLEGNYSAMLGPSAISGAETGGILTLRVTGSGLFTARLILGGKTYSVRGQFDPATGIAGPILIQRKRPLPALTLTLTLGMNRDNRGQLMVEISDGLEAVSASGMHRIWPSPSAIQAFVQGNLQRYNAVLDPAAAPSVSVPQGSGFLTIRLRPDGNARVKGLLADGTKIVFAAYVGPSGQSPVYVSLYRKQGYLRGTLDFDPGPDPDDLGDNVVSGYLDWLRPSNFGGGLYPAGFDTGLDVAGGAYFSPARSHRVLQLGEGDLHAPVVIEFNEVMPPDQTTGEVMISKNNSARVAPLNATDSISLDFNAALGTFRGRVIIREPLPRRAADFTGALLHGINPDDASGYGFFLMRGPGSDDTILSGQVIIGR